MRHSQLVGRCYLLVLSGVYMAPTAAKTSHTPQSCTPLVWSKQQLVEDSAYKRKDACVPEAQSLNNEQQHLVRQTCHRTESLIISNTICSAEPAVQQISPSL